MEPLAGLLAVAIGFGGANVARIIGSASGDKAVSDPSDPRTWLTQLGVTAVCIIIGWWMLRRSDRRDATAQAAESKSHSEQVAVLSAQLELERREREKADGRAKEATDRLIEVFQRLNTEPS